MSRVVRNENVGAGFYGGPAISHKTACAQSNNPYGHNPACPCRRASQSVPYSEDDPVWPPSPNRWWHGDDE